MQFAIGVIVLECSFVKHSHGPLGVKDDSILRIELQWPYKHWGCLENQGKKELGYES
jgi:hypothetical protein